jgi:hypothetical protein
VATATVGRVRARTLAEPLLFRLTLGFVALTQVGAHVDAW